MARHAIARRLEEHVLIGVHGEDHPLSAVKPQDLQRARRFYAEKLGLEPIEERPGGLRYQSGDGNFTLFESSGAPSGQPHADGLASR